MAILYAVHGIPLVVSDEDYQWARQFVWYAIGNRVSANQKGESGWKTIGLGREILLRMGINLAGLECDHANRDPLDNRRENLRPATHSQNTQNKNVSRNSKSGSKNVFYCMKTGKYRAYGTVDGVQIQIGKYKSKDRAISMANRFALMHHGEFAVLQSTSKGDWGL